MMHVLDCPCCRAQNTSALIGHHRLTYCNICGCTWYESRRQQLKPIISATVSRPVYFDAAEEMRQETKPLLFPYAMRGTPTTSLWWVVIWLSILPIGWLVAWGIAELLAHIWASNGGLPQ